MQFFLWIRDECQASFQGRMERLGFWGHNTGSSQRTDSPKLPFCVPVWPTAPTRVACSVAEHHVVLRSLWPGGTAKRPAEPQQCRAEHRCRGKALWIGPHGLQRQGIGLHPMQCLMNKYMPLHDTPQLRDPFLCHYCDYCGVEKFAHELLPW